MSQNQIWGDGTLCLHKDGQSGLLTVTQVQESGEIKTIVETSEIMEATTQLDILLKESITYDI